jgi:hypothetical protein
MEGYAQDCIRLARLASDPEIRDELVKMAGQWMAAATGSKQHQTTRHQSTPATFLDTPRSRHVAGVGAKKRLRALTGRLQRQNAPSGDGCAPAKGTRSAPNRR